MQNNGHHTVHVACFIVENLFVGNMELNGVTVVVTWQWPLRLSRSFKVSDFGINRKPICDFLLVINTSLPPILHSSHVMADYWSNFRYRHGSASL